MVLAVLPDGVNIQSFPFTLNYQPCAYPTFTAQEVQDVIYTTGDPGQSFEIAEFDVDQEACVGLVTYTNQITPYESSVFSNNDG